VNVLDVPFDGDVDSPMVCVFDKRGLEAELLQRGSNQGDIVVRVLERADRGV